MDKILSAEEWVIKNTSKYNNQIELWKAYSTYLLEAFVGEVKNDNKIYFVEGQSIDQLLTKFKEKL
jgi:hypothetical protein